MVDDRDESENRYRTLFDQTPIGVFLFDRQLILTDCNPRLVQLLRTTYADLVGLDLRMLPDPKVASAAERAIAGETATYEGAYETRAGRGPLILNVRLSPVRNGLGAITGGIGMIDDVTERRNVLDALRRSEARYRALIENAPDSIGVFRDGINIYSNPAMARFLGFDRAADLVGVPVVSTLHPDDVPIFEERNRRRAQGVALPPQEYRLVRRDGTIVTAEIASMVSDFDGAPAVLCHLRDVSERKLLQRQLQQADRMVSIGTLTAGIAHEINNPLAYLMVNLEVITARKLPALMLEAESLESDRLRVLLAEMASMVSVAREGAERVRDIVRDLKTFSRADDQRRTPVDIRPVLDAAISMAWNEIRHRAALVREYGDVEPIEANESRLGQVFVNLLVNAAQAIAPGNASENQITVRARMMDSGQLLVEIADTGCGIEPEVVNRIFDPFFTTKPVGVGTGLGLSICQGIITALGGMISVESSPGRGATFRVMLPARTGHAQVPAQRRTTQEPRGRQGRVLVVDDDAAVATSLRTALSEEHDVTVTSDGREALEVLRAGERFDVVLCDLMMPDMTGMELFEHVSRDYPEVQENIVFVTGGAFTARAREFLDTAPNTVIEKPFDMDALRSMIRRRVNDRRR